jgi:hypothetical protein
MMRGAGLAVVVGLTLSACTGSTPEPEVTAPSSGGPTPAVTASASPAPSAPAKPKRPEAMKRDDAQGAAAAAEYFIELYPYVMATGDTEEFEAMSHRACGFCDDAIGQAERIEEQGYTYSGGDSVLTVTKIYARDEVTGIFPLDTEIHQRSSLIVGDLGEEIFSSDTKVSKSRVEMGIRNDDWVVVTVAPVPEK